MGGREGVTITAAKIPECGYLQRKMVRTAEDVIASYNGMLMNSKKSIISFSYGRDNMDISKLVPANGKLQFINVQSFVNSLNTEYELSEFKPAETKGEDWNENIENSNPITSDKDFLLSTGIKSFKNEKFVICHSESILPTNFITKKDEAFIEYLSVNYSKLSREEWIKELKYSENLKSMVSFQRKYITDINRKRNEFQNMGKGEDMDITCYDDFLS